MLDRVTRPIGSVLGHLGRTAGIHSPLAETREAEHHLHDAVGAAHRATDSLESHIAAVEALVEALVPLAESLAPLGQSLPPLTDSVTRLSEQIGELLRVTAPLAAAEREVSRVEHLFGRRRSQPPPSDRP